MPLKEPYSLSGSYIMSQTPEPPSPKIRKQPVALCGMAYLSHKERRTFPESTIALKIKEYSLNHNMKPYII